MGLGCEGCMGFAMCFAMCFARIGGAFLVRGEWLFLCVYSIE